MGRSPRRAVISTLAALLGPAASLSAQVTDVDMSDRARTYLDSALNIIETHSLHRHDTDWPAFRQRVLDRATGAREPVDTSEALRWGLKELDPHSFMQISDELRDRERERSEARGIVEVEEASTNGGRVRSPFSGRREPERELHEIDGIRMGRIAIPAFGGSRLTEFAGRIEGYVRELDEAGACGWIVDLRGNGGGNMWPMLAGIGSVLGQGDIGQFHGPDGLEGTWFYREGASGIVAPDGEVITTARVSGEPYRLGGSPPVAVMFDGGTGSSGEATAIAFLGRPNVRTFGMPSFGFTTANDGYRLPDGANMVLTVGVDADRNGVAYYDRLEPDERVTIVPGNTIPESAPPSDQDPQIRAALAWLAEQQACRN